VSAVVVLGMGTLAQQPGGLNRFVGGLTGALAGTGVDVSSVAADQARPLAARLLSTARAARAAAGADVVDAHFALYAWWPVAHGSLRRHPLVAHVHGSWAGESGTDPWPVRRAKQALERAVYRRASRVVVLSQAVRDLAVHRYGVDPARIVVLGPGVDRERFSPGPAVRDRLGLPTDAPVLLTVRRLVPRTGVDVLVDAVAGLPGAHLAVVGDGPERARLERRAAPLGSRVTFAGRVPDAELADWYRSADVAVVPSRAHEGWGLVVDEALSCGTPVVASRLGGLPEALAGTPDDALVPPGDATALRDRLRTALDGSAPLPVAAACRAATEGRDWSAVARSTAQVYAAVQRPRVVVVGHCARPSGAELGLVRLAPLLARSLELTVVLGEDGPVADRLRAAGVCVDVLPLAGAAAGSRRAVGPLAAASAAAWSVRFAGLLRRRRAQVVHAWTARAGLLAGPAARATGVPLVWSARDRLAPDYLPGRSAAVLRAAADRLADVVVANSAATLQTWHPRRGRTAVVPSPGVVSGPVPRAEVGPWTVATLSRLAPWKGHDLVLRAFAQAFPDGPQRLRVLGAAWFGEQDVAGQLRSLAVELGVADRLDLVGHRDDVAAELATVDAVVAYTRSPEPFGQVVVDAMTAGRPVIAAAEGGPAATVTDGVDGLLVPPRDPAALSVALRRLHDDDDLARRLAAGGRRTAERYAPERLAQALVAVHREVLACRR
jgi:glycosyltransferase involved in cell wall biosynthesis